MLLLLSLSLSLSLLISLLSYHCNYHHHYYHCCHYSNYVYFWWYWIRFHWLDVIINSLQQSDAHLWQQTKPSMIQIMNCCLFGAKPLCKPKLVVNCQFNYLPIIVTRLVLLFTDWPGWGWRLLHKSNPILRQSHILQCTIWWQTLAHMCTFLLQNGPLWDMCPVHCGIYEMDLLSWNYQIRVLLSFDTFRPRQNVRHLQTIFWSFFLVGQLYNFDSNFQKFISSNSTNREPGGRLNKKDGLTRYGNSHVKDKTS